MTQLWWYTARSTGIVAWALLAAGIVWGLLLSTKALGRRPRPNWMLDLHRFLGGASVVFVALHVVSIILDSYVHFNVVQVLVPFTASWHPAAVAWGIASLYLLLAVEITSLLRNRISKRAWRLTHFASFPLYLTATTHAFSAGTDGTAIAFRVAAVAVTALIIGLTTLRITESRRRPPTRQVPVRTELRSAVRAPRSTPEAGGVVVPDGQHRPVLVGADSARRLQTAGSMSHREDEAEHAVVTRVRRGPLAGSS